VASAEFAPTISGGLIRFVALPMPKITAIETAIPAGIMPNLVLVRIHTDDGFIGCGETYYTPHAIAALVHDWMAEQLLGGDALAVESHWRFLYERCTPFGHPGAELRALSAVDVALWDILGQACGQPVYRLLGGPVRDAIPIYNTCGGPGYGAVSGAGESPRHPGWPGYGDVGKAGALQDTRRVIDLAQTFNIPATIHDCTGPLTLFAGLHLAASSTNVVFHETVRAHIRSFYDKLVDTLPVIEQGKAHLPAGPGLGTKLREDLFQPGLNSYRRSDVKR
jgi:L-alanine-DL-glutamate epimerase-like enolase superfamily enzyme